MAFKLESFVMGPVATNCYLLSGAEGDKAIVVDPPVAGEKIHELVKARCLSVCAILITHGHFDHIGGVNALRDSSGAKVYAPEAEKEMLLDPSVNLSDEGCSVRADHYVKDGEELKIAGLEIRVIHTPGHTSGGCCYHLSKESVLISGDTLFEGSVGRTDFPTGSSSALIRSIREKLMVLPDETKVYPGHGPETSIGEERKYNPFL